MNSVLLVILPEFISHIKKLIGMMIVWIKIIKGKFFPLEIPFSLP